MSVLQSFDSGSGTGVLAPPRLRSRGRPVRPEQGGPPLPPTRAGNGDDGHGGEGPGDGEPRPPGPDPRPADTGAFALALTLVAITTLFAVLVVIWILLRLDRGTTFQGPSPPAALWASGVWLALSSVTFELALRAVRPRRIRAVRTLLGSTLLLGLGFVANQVVLWRGLVEAGQVPAASGYAAILFMVTGLHALHLLGGLAFLAWLIARDTGTAPLPLRRRRLRLGAVYWHFMGLLWAGLFTLLILLR